MNQAEPTSVVRALVIDDEPIVGRLMKSVLADYAEVQVTNDLEGAIHCLMESTDFDLVLCDLSLGRGSGPALYAWILANRPDLLGRLGFVTGGACTDEGQRFLAEVRPPCLLKPFLRKDLLRFASSLLSVEARPSNGIGPRPMG